MSGQQISSPEPAADQPASPLLTRPPAYPDDVPRVVDVPAVSVAHLLRDAARSWPDRIAVDFLGATLSYAELDRRVRRAARGLLELGVRPGDRVAVALPNCASHVIAFHAILRIGAIAVEHNPTYSAQALAHQLADSGSRVAIVWEKTAVDALAARTGSDLETVIAVDISRDLPLRRRLLLRLPVRAAKQARAALRGPVPDAALRWERVVAKDPIPEDHPFPAPDDPALLQYTGGTTGTPKAAVLLHRNLVANCMQNEAWIRRDAAGPEVIDGVLPFFHAFGLQVCLVLGIHIGATLVVFPKFDVAEVLATQRRRPCTFMPAVPPMLDRIQQAAVAEGVDLSSITFAFSGAMPLPAATATAWEQATGGYVIEGYGMTETSPIALGNPLSPARRPGALGLPFPSTEIRIVDPETLIDVPPGSRGELLIRGPQVFAGYWNRPEETAEQLLPDGFLRTGDIVVVDEDGFVTLVDRIKEMIVTGGFKVYPSQVEDLLRDMPGIAEVAIVGVPAGDLGEKVVAAVVLDGSVALTAAEVRDYAAGRVARYASPREVHFVADLPRSMIGKIMRRVVREDLLAAGPGPGAPAG